MKTSFNFITNDEAFATADEDSNSPGIIPEHNFDFTRRWFKQRNQKTWIKYLLPLFQDDRPYNMLQIGVFEGMDLVWCLQHLLKHPDSRVVAVDPWMETRKLDQQYMEGVHDRAKHNVEPYSEKVRFVRAFSGEWLTVQTVIKRETLDLIVIDGDHTADAVFDDASLSLPLAKPGAIMVFDDVRQRVPKPHEVQAGLTRFLDEFGHKVQYVAQHRYSDIFRVI